jgi:hypothetical protein
MSAYIWKASLLCDGDPLAATVSPKKFLSMLCDTSVPPGPKTVLIGAVLTTKTQLRARRTEAASEPSYAEKPTSSAVVSKKELVSDRGQ